MDRRRFVRGALTASALAVGTGGLVFARRAIARHALREELLGAALPPLAAKSLRELDTLPIRARYEMTEYFHGRCLNVKGFVADIYSDGFIERFARCRSQEDQHSCLLQAFFSRVASETGILRQVEKTTDQVGAELDSAWSTYSVSVNSSWNVRVTGLGPGLSSAEFCDRLDGLIRKELHEAVLSALAAGLPPALGETIDKIGSSALRLLPLVRDWKLGLQVGLPAFFILAAGPIWEFVTARLQERRRECQAAVSEHVATLSDRVGAEFEREIRRRISDLHKWQEHALRVTAEQIACERVV